MKLQVIIENGDRGELFGRIEGRGNFLPVTTAKSFTGIILNLKSLIADYKKHEGKTDKAWSKVDVAKVSWEPLYDVQAFFMEHDYLNASVIAQRAGINPGLMRQYSSGVKHPRAAQAQKIEKAIAQIAKELKAVALYAA